MKKKLFAAFTALCVITAGAAGLKMTTSASSAEISVTAAAQSVKKEQVVDVSVSVNSDVLIEKVSTTIAYDDTVLEFVGSDDPAAVGASGIINISDTFEMGSYGKTYQLQFKAIEVGTCTLNITDSIAEAFDSADVIDISSYAVDITVGINRTESDEARLSDLLIAPETPEEVFSPDLYEYHVTVGADTDQILLSAVPMDENSVVTLDKPETLAYGENCITINVSSVSGKTSTYTIYVNRLDSTIQNEVLNDQPESIIVEESENAAEDTAVSETVTEMTDDMLQAELEADMAALDAIE